MGKEIYAGCVNCGKRYSVDIEHMDQVKCPQCGGEIVPETRDIPGGNQERGKKAVPSVLSLLFSGMLLDAPFRKLNNLVDEKFIEKPVRWMSFCGRAMPPAAAAFGLLYGLMLLKYTENGNFLFKFAILFFLVVFCLQYLSERFRQVSEKIIQDSMVTIFSPAIIESFAFAAMGAAVIWPFWLLLADQSDRTIGISIFIFTSFMYPSLLLMKPDMLGIRYDEKTCPGGTLLSLLFVFQKLILKTATLISGVMCMVGTFRLLRILFETFSAEKPLQQIIENLPKAIDSGKVVIIALLVIPALTLAALSVLYIINLGLAILSLKKES